MKTACLMLGALVLVAIMAICVMLKFTTDISVEEKTRDELTGPTVFRLSKSMGVISLSGSSSPAMSERFPYVAAVTRNSSDTWSFSCFASVILVKWIVTSAHCRKAGSTHRVLLYHDFVKNYTHTYPILLWRLHEKYNSSSIKPLYDIAVAKMNIDLYRFTMKSSTFDEIIPTFAEASVWKTVATMDKRMFLTNDFEKFEARIVNRSKCSESYGVSLDDSVFCVDMSQYDDCFVHEFGPIFVADKVVGIIAVKPRECDLKLAVFTNVSFYTTWILKATRTTHYG